MRRALSAVLIVVIAFTLLAVQAYAVTTLSVGSRGSDVTRVQKRLIQYGYLKGPADGIYGAATQAAVKEFQRKNKLTADGKVGAKTAAALGVTLGGSGGSAARTTSASAVSSDQRLLARLVYAEARGESYKGKVAVAAVVLNRVRSSKFPNTISGVIYQKGAFSVVSNGSINNTPDSESLRAARDAMNGWDPTGGCLYFFNPKSTSDAWIRTRTVKTVIGSHKFAV